MIRVLSGFLVMVASTMLGVYLGVGWCFVGGTEQLFAARGTPDMVFALIRILFSAPAMFGTLTMGLLAGCPLSVPKEIS